MGKRLENAKKGLDPGKVYTVAEASSMVKKNATAKFDESVELHIKLGIDPKQSDQQVRGTVVLPHGTGKTRKVIVIAKGEKTKEAQTAGADEVGGADLIDKIAKGYLDFDVLVATPDMMKDVTRLGKTLGPRGLMPNPKSGTVTFDVSRTVKELKAGRVEFKADPSGIIHLSIGKASFPEEHTAANAQTVLEVVMKAKPSSSKGIYLQSVHLSSTMGPGISVDSQQKQ
ncbi:MAG: 50S ribosomal protein L1 [bacterium]